MTASPEAPLFHVLVEGRAPEPFFQVLVIRVEASSLHAVERAAAKYLERLGAEFVELDAEETKIVGRDTPPPAWLLPSLSPEGIYAASGRIYALQSDER